MKKFLIVTTLSLTMTMGLTAHAETDKAPKESKMGLCHKDAKAKALKGDERKAFMKECLSAKGPATSAKTTMQSKTKACNEETKGLKGEDQKQKFNDCMKA